MSAKVTKENKVTKPSVLKHWSTWLLIATAALLLLVANSGLWVNRYVFNADAFADVMTDSLTSSDSRKAIAGAVAERAFEGRPIAARLLTEPTTNLVEGLLGSDQASKALHLVAERTNIALTSQEKKSITLDLTQVKNVLGLISSVASKRTDSNGFDVDKIPDSVTLVDAEKLPDLYGYSVAMLWLAPLALIGALVALVVPHLRARKLDERLYLVMFQGGAIVVAGLVALAIGPLFRPIVLGNIVETLPRTVVASAFDAFIATFNAQSRNLFVIGSVMIVAALGVKLAVLYKTYRKK